MCSYRGATGKAKCQFPAEVRPGPWAGDWCLFHEPLTEPRKRSDAAWQELQTRLNELARRASAANQSIDLSGVQIPPRVTLSAQQLSGLILDEAVIDSDEFLHQVQLLGPLQARAAKFLPRMDFDESTFSDTVDLDRARFEHGASFAACTFQKNVMLTAVRSTGDLVLSKSKFLGCLIAERLQIERTLFMTNDVEFHNIIRLEGAVISRLECLATKFFDHALMGGLSVREPAIMRFCEFHGVATFANAHFISGVSFQRSKFKDQATFVATNFGPDADFIGVQFESKSYFDADATQDNPGPCEFQTALFRGARFGQLARFTNRAFAKHTDFGNAVFSVAPDFHGCKIHQSIVFPSRKGFTDTSSREAARAYRTLKLTCEQLRAREDESVFFALEQESLRRSSQTALWHKVLLTLYWLISDYGRSSWRALCWLSILTATATVAYAAWSSPVISPSFRVDAALLGRALEFSIEQTVNPFGLYRRDLITFPSDASPTAVRLVATVHSMLALATLTLFLLAIRWRFKRE